MVCIVSIDSVYDVYCGYCVYIDNVYGVHCGHCFIYIVHGVN